MPGTAGAKKVNKTDTVPRSSSVPVTPAQTNQLMVRAQSLGPDCSLEVAFSRHYSQDAFEPGLIGYRRGCMRQTQCEQTHESEKWGYKETAPGRGGGSPVPLLTVFGAGAITEHL